MNEKFKVIYSAIVEELEYRHFLIDMIKDSHYYDDEILKFPVIELEEIARHVEKEKAEDVETAKYYLMSSRQNLAVPHLPHV